MLRAGFDATIAWHRTAGLVLCGLLGVSLLLNLAQYVWRPEPVTVLLPAAVSGGYELRGSRFDERWLADSAAEVVHLFYNAAPSTLARRRAALMRWVHPAAQEAIGSRLSQDAADIRRKRLSSAFAVRAVEAAAVTEREAEMAVEGVLTRWVADRRISSEPVRVLVRFMRDARGAPLLAGISADMDAGTADAEADR